MSFVDHDVIIAVHVDTANLCNVHFEELQFILIVCCLTDACDCEVLVDGNFSCVLCSDSCVCYMPDNDYNDLLVDQRGGKYNFPNLCEK